jgi:hypothetical protein
VNRIVLGLQMLKEVDIIKKNLKETQDRKKKYVDRNILHMEFIVGGHDFLRVKSMMSSLNLGGCDNLARRYYGPFAILDRIGLVAYRLTLISKVHNVSHVCLLKKYVHDPNQTINWDVI